MEIQTCGDEIVGILMKLKDDTSADLTDSQKADEKDRTSDRWRLAHVSEAARQGKTAVVIVEQPYPLLHPSPTEMDHELAELFVGVLVADDVHRSLCDSLSLCGAATHGHSLLW